MNLLLAEQLQRRLRSSVRLRQHRRACLDENVVAGKLRAFFCDINICDAAVRSNEVILQDA